MAFRSEKPYHRQAIWQSPFFGEKPLPVSALRQFTTDYMEFTPKIAPTFTLYVRMLLAMGLVFELPTLVLFLARVGVVTPRFLLRHTKYAILFIFIAAAIITPGPDVVSQVLVAGPMFVLYLLSIVIAWIFQRRPSADDA